MVTVPTPEAVTYDPAQTLESVTLPDGWAWADQTIVPTVGNEGYAAEYTVPDDANYDYTNVEGYDAQTHKVTRTVALTVNKAEVTAPTIASKVYNTEKQTADVAASDLYSVTTNDGGINAGDYDVVFTLADAANYKWTDSEEAAKTLTFTITKTDAPEVVTPSLAAVTYDPAQTLESMTLPDGWAWADPTIVPTVGNEGYAAEYTVPDDANYDYTNVEGYDAQTHKVTRTLALTVSKADSSPATVAANNRTYDGREKPLVNVSGKATGGEMRYALGTDATTAPADDWGTSVPTATKAGTYYVWYRVAGDDNHLDCGPACMEVTVKPAHDSSVSSRVAITSVSAPADATYTGKAIEPSVTVKAGSQTLKAGTDYTVAYKNNTNTGTATVTVTGRGGYEGTKSVTFKVNPAAITGVSKPADVTYTGKAIEPAVTVKAGSKTLKADADYKVTYKGNVDAGTATVTVKGKGNYTGSKSATFKVKPAAITSVSKPADAAYTGKAIKPVVTVKAGSKILKSGTDYTVSYKDNTKVGMATVTVKGKGNYEGTKSVTFRITVLNNRS